MLATGSRQSNIPTMVIILTDALLRKAVIRNNKRPKESPEAIAKNSQSHSTKLSRNQTIRKLGIAIYSQLHFHSQLSMPQLSSSPSPSPSPKSSHTSQRSPSPQTSSHSSPPIPARPFPKSPAVPLQMPQQGISYPAHPTSSSCLHP